MDLLTIVMSICLSFFSTVVMSYIAMATPIGPWIAPTLVLLSLLLFRLCGRNRSLAESMVLVTSAGSLGGIIATGCGFSFPAIYFFDPVLFSQWLSDPLFFVSRLSILVAASAGFGFFLANIFEQQLCEKEGLPFPVSIMIHKMITAGNQLRKAYELIVGFVSTTFFCIMQDGLWVIKSMLPKTVTLLPPVTLAGIRIPMIGFDLWPMTWAIGFITGHLIAVPLAVGAGAKICFIDPVNSWFFSDISTLSFTFAFCSGMVSLGLLENIAKVPSLIKKAYFYIMQYTITRGAFFAVFKGREQSLLSMVVIACLWIMGFSLVQMVYLLVFTAIFSYQMVVIAAKWGVAPLGRYATFVMLPAMAIFKLGGLYAIYIATFVEICGGVAYDVLCGRMVARKQGVRGSVVKRYQYLGMVVSVFIIGIVFFMLIQHCRLGSAELCAYKAQSRHLLINVVLNGNGFNIGVLMLGALFGFILSRLTLNPTLVLGGILMPLNLSMGLIFGGLLTCLVADRQEWEPFFSGVFAANSMWMLFKALI